MNLSKNTDCMIPIMDYLRKHGDSMCVKVEISITPCDFVVTTHYKSADDLALDNISMRNFQGKFIHEEEIKEIK